MIVSDDSPQSDRRSETVNRDFPGTIYRAGPRRGLAANRNAALEIVASDHVHFIDDDVVVPPDFYARAADAVRDNAPRSVISGFEWGYVDGPQAAPVRYDPPYCGFWPHLRSAAGRPANCAVINATIFPREFLAVERFDECMKYGCEESDITLRAIHAGYAFVSDPRLFVHHYSSKANRSVYKDWVIASQVYAGLKRQWLYQGSGWRTAAFALVAVPRLVLHQGRHGGPRAFAAGVRQAWRGVGYFIARRRSAEWNTAPSKSDGR